MIPWIICGCGTYIICIIAMGNINILFEPLEWIKWILGYETWLYYVPVLLICMLVYQWKRDVWFIGLMIILNIISHYLTVCAFLENDYFISYQNPFNWFGFFGIGILLRDKFKILEFDLSKCKKTGRLLLLAIGITVLLSFGYLYLLGEDALPGYWNHYSLYFELLMVPIIYILSFVLHKSRFLSRIGKWSYPIYFLHMQVGMKITNLVFWNHLKEVTNTCNIGIMVLVRPLLIVVFSSLILCIIELLLKKIHLEKYKWLYGG